MGNNESVPTTSTTPPVHTPTPLSGDISKLRQQIKGTVVCPDDPEYEKQRQNIFNKDCAGYPSVIVVAENLVDDVIAVVKFAKENSCAICIAGGRHSNVCMINDALMLDMSKFNQIEIDPENKIVSAGAGIKLGSLDMECAKYNLVVPVGHNPDTGIAGLTLGGGVGFLVRKFGMTIDNLIKVDMVLASGEAVVASETENPDLFWAIRGGGGNFGVVTKFTLKLHEIPPKIMGGTKVFLDIPIVSGNILSHPKEATKRVVDYLEASPDDVGAMLIFPGGGTFVSAWAYYGSLEDGKQEFEKFSQVSGFSPLNNIGPTTHHFDVQQIALGPNKDQQASAYYFEKGVMVEHIPPEMIDKLWEQMQQPVPTGVTAVVAAVLIGGAAGRVPSDATAYYHRAAKWWVLMLTASKEYGTEEQRKAKEDWVRKTHAEMAKFSVGTYAPVINAEKSSSKSLEFVYGSNLPKLEELKKKYDPTNLFRLNRNITSNGAIDA